MIPLGQKVKQARKEKGLTQAELADNSISRSMLSLIENGLSYPSMPTLEYIARKLEKPISYFLSEQESLDEKCALLISSLEHLHEIGEYNQIIEKINEFINNYLGSNTSSLKGRYTGILYSILGTAYYNVGDKKAFDFLNNAIEYLQSDDTKAYLCRTYNYLGLLMHREKDYAKMEYYMSLADKTMNNVFIENFQLKLNISYHLSLSYYHQHKYALVIQKITEILESSKKYDLYYNFGDLSMLLAFAYRNLNNLESAIKYTNKAINYYSLTDNKYMMYRFYVNLSILYRLTNDYNNSLKYVNDAIDYLSNTKDSARLINAVVEKIKTLFIMNVHEGTIMNLINDIRDNLNNNQTAKGEILCILGTLELRRKNYEEALPLLQEAEIILADDDITDMKVYTYHGLCKIHEYYKNLENAYFYLQKVNDLISVKSYYKNLIN